MNTFPDVNYRNMTSEYYSAAQVADILGVSKDTLRKWSANGTLVPSSAEHLEVRAYHYSQLHRFEQARSMFQSAWEDELQVQPVRNFKLVELFAGAGGLAIGLEKAGLQSVLLNEVDKHACATLRKNRPEWNVIEGDIRNVDFSEYKDQIDILTGGFPCQAFSYAGKKLGFEDTRGTLFFEFARAVKESRPKVIVAENVRGLLEHDDGNTLRTITNVIDELGYDLVEPKVLKAIFYQVPQKRERLILVAIRKDLSARAEFRWPSPSRRLMTVRDALKAGELYATDVPPSEGQRYPKRKSEILSQVPQGGYWRDLPDDLQREYMQKSYFLGGGKTGMARRLAWDERSQLRRRKEREI